MYMPCPLAIPPERNYLKSQVQVIKVSELQSFKTIIFHVKD